MRLRAAVPEAAAQSLPIHGLGARAGAAEAAAEFDALLAAIFPELVDQSDEIELVDDIEPTDEPEVAPHEGEAVESVESVESMSRTNGHSTQPVGSVADRAGWTA